MAAARRRAALLAYKGEREMAAKALARARASRTYDRRPVPSYALNFYSPIVEAQLRSHRKTATIRLGDKSRKYQKGMIVSVLVGARYGPRAARLRRGHRQGRGEARSPSSLRARSSTTTPRSAARRRWRTSSASSTTGTVTEEDVVTVIRFSAISRRARPRLACSWPAASRRYPKSSGWRELRAARLAVDRERRTRTAPSTTGSGGAISPPQRRALAPGSRPRTPRTSAARRRSEAERRPVAEHLAPLLAQPVRGLAHESTLRTGRCGQAVQGLSPFRAGVPSPAAHVPRSLRCVRLFHDLSRDGNGDRTRSRAERLAPAGEGVGPRPRGPARHLPQHADHARRRGARATSSTGRARSPARSTPAAATRPSSVGVATAMGPDDVGTPLHRDMGVHITRGVEPWRIFANYMGRADGPAQGPRRERPHGRRRLGPDRDGLAPARDAPGRGRLRARLPHPRGEARRGRLVRRGRRGARRHARVDELRRRAPAARGLHLRQQPVGLLDADPPRVRRRAPRRPRRGLRLRGRRRRRHRRARRLPRGEARDREGARGRRADADRVPDAPHGGPRGPRRRLLRPEGALRAVGRARPARALPHLAARARRVHRRRGGRDHACTSRSS